MDDQQTPLSGSTGRPSHLPSTETESRVLHDGESAASGDDSVAPMQSQIRASGRVLQTSSAKRRSSAASSRRNSISSTHSRSSHASLHSLRLTEQSSHVAQHLRRASILESRRARLAERAEHGERVRLRAAMQKATQRTSKYAERALAAQKARERYLAKVAANCEEEVRKSKRIAEEMREKREADERKQREEMEEKLAEAEKRRADLLELRNTRRPRAQSTIKADRTKLVRDVLVQNVDQQAAKVIQKAWRAMTRRRIVSHFMQQRLSITEVRKRPFEMVSAVLADQRVVSATSALLALVSTNFVDGPSSESRTLTRQFLSAFLIVGHPKQVLSGNGEQEIDLHSRAQALLISFEEALSALQLSRSSTITSIQRASFAQIWNLYSLSFRAWKSQDSSTIVQTMVDQYVELDAMWQKIKHDEIAVVRENFETSIKEQQVMLLVRIKRLAGPDRARVLLRSAIRASRRRNEGLSSTIGASQGTANPPTATIPLGSEGLTTVIPKSDPPGPSILPTPPPSPVRDPAVAPEYTEEEVAQLGATIPANRQLVHEIALDPNFRVQLDSARSSVHVRSEASQLDSMRSAYQAGFAVEVVTAIAQHIQSQLLHLLPNKSGPTHQLIKEALDPSYIKQQFTTGNFSFESFFGLLASILPRMCAPFRDGEVKQLLGERDGDEFDRLRRIVQILDLMRLDHTNFMLQSSAQTLIKEAPGYEARAFRADLRNRTRLLDHTKHWWRTTISKLKDEAARSHQSAAALSVERIYLEGLCHLVTSNQTLPLPETLHLDAAHVSSIRNGLRAVVLSSAVLLTAKNLLRRDVRASWKSEAARIESVLNGIQPNNQASTGEKILAIIDGSHQLPSPTKHQLTLYLQRLIPSAIPEGASLKSVFGHASSDPVVRLLGLRLRSVLMGRLLLAQSSATAAGTQDRVKAISRYNDVLSQNGMSEWTRKISDVSDQLARIAEVDRAGHGQWYEQVAAEVAAEEPSSGAG